MNYQSSILQVGDVLLSSDIITERFCCDLDACKGACCVEGEAGAPVSLDEIGEIETSLDEVWPQMSAGAQAVVDRQGVAYNDVDGDLVTSIVDGRDCVFTCHENGLCLCLLEKAFREGRSGFCKPISCALYPIREKRLSNGLTALNYHRWSVCAAARKKGEELGLYVYESSLKNRSCAASGVSGTTSLQPSPRRSASGEMAVSCYRYGRM